MALLGKTQRHIWQLVTTCGHMCPYWVVFGAIKDHGGPQVAICGLIGYGSEAYTIIGDHRWPYVALLCRVQRNTGPRTMGDHSWPNVAILGIGI